MEELEEVEDEDEDEENKRKKKGRLYFESVWLLEPGMFYLSVQICSILSYHVERKQSLKN